MNVIVFEQVDRSVGVIVPAPGLSAEDVVKDIPAGCRHSIMDVSHLPSDRTRRDEWRLSEDGHMVYVQTTDTI
jgi:hypothetical protein